MKRIAFPIGIKIFGVASSMLALLLAVAYLNHRNIAQVNNQLIDLAFYLTKLTEDVAVVNVHALEQEIHYERVVRLLEQEMGDRELINTEIAKFESRGQQVDQEIAQAIARVDQALENATQIPNIIQFARIQPQLEDLEIEHQNFHDQSLKVIELLRAQQSENAEILDQQLDEFEQDFDTHLQAVLFELGEASALSARRAEVYEREALQVSWMLAALAMGLGLSFATFITLGLIRPLRRLVESTEAIEQGHLEVTVPVTSRDEVGQLATVFNTMIADIQAKEHLKATFGQYVDPRIVDRLVDQSGGAIATQRQEMTVFFSDIAGFSRISEMLTPAGLVTLINHYLTLASEPILAREGMINQFIGDAVTAFWGPPFVSETNHAEFACYAALEQLSQLVKLRRLLPEIMGIRKGLPEIQIRIGLATGELIAGSLGAEQSKSYTVMGWPMQVAEYLEGANKRYGTTILLTAATRQQAADAIATRPIDRVILPSQSEPSVIYELLDTVGNLTATQTELRDRFEVGMAAYWAQNWELAASHFEVCGAIAPEDEVTQLYLQRVKLLRSQELGESWDGVWREEQTETRSGA